MGCATCQQNKILTYKLKTPLYRITTEEGTLPFQRIAMDLITGLPKHKGKDAILTIVDHGCSRAAIFLPCSTTITGPEIAQLYMDHVYRWFGLPTKVISDRDPRFTSHFGKALSQKLGIQQNLSTAFHPQTDGLSERKNQWIEQYLRLVTSASPEDWTHWLALATAVHNNRRNSTTDLSPNQILLGYDLSLIPSRNTTSNNDLVEKHMEILLERRAQAIDAINQSAKQDQGGISKYKIGDQVWLEATHLKLRHQKTKLAPKHYGPFTVTKEISPVAYQIKLPTSWGIHNVFHASLLSPYHETPAFGPNFSHPPPDLIGGEEEYEVERILNHRRHGRSRRLQYFIKWKGYPESDNTWEPADQIHAPDLLKAYHQSNPLEDKRESIAAANHTPLFPIIHLSRPTASPCPPKNPPTPAVKMTPQSPSPQPLLPSWSPPHHWISFSETFPISMSAHLGGYWAELSAPCDRTRKPTTAKRCGYVSKSKRWSGALSTMRSSTLSARRGMRPMWGGPPRFTSQAPIGLPSSSSGSSSSTTDVWLDLASIKQKGKPRILLNYSSPLPTTSRTRLNHYPGGSTASSWGFPANLISSTKKSPSSTTGVPWPRSSATELSWINSVRSGTNSRSSTHRLTGCWSDAAYVRPAWKQGRSRLR